MSDYDIIKDLSQITYRIFADNIELYTKALTIIRNNKEIQIKLILGEK
jgi:hypothetical protein